MSKKNGLADPTRLKPFDSDDKQMLRVVIETPKGSRNKFAFDPDEHIFELKKVCFCERSRHSSHVALADAGCLRSVGPSLSGGGHGHRRRRMQRATYPVLYRSGSESRHLQPPQFLRR